MQNPEFNKLQNNLTYRFLYDPLTCKYNGTTYELKEINTTDVKPHFEAGYVTVFDTIKQKWTLVLESDYYSKVENRYTPTSRTEYATTQTLYKTNEIEKLIFQIYNQQKTDTQILKNTIDFQDRSNNKLFPILEGLRVTQIQQHESLEHRYDYLSTEMKIIKQNQFDFYNMINDNFKIIIHQTLPFHKRIYLWLKNKLKK